MGMLDKVRTENGKRVITLGDTLDSVKADLEKNGKGLLVIGAIAGVPHMFLASVLASILVGTGDTFRTIMALFSSAITAALPVKSHLFSAEGIPMGVNLLKLTVSIVAPLPISVPLAGKLLKKLKEKQVELEENQHLRGQRLVEPTIVYEMVKEARNDAEENLDATFVPLGVIQDVPGKPMSYEDYSENFLTKKVVMPLLKDLETSGIFFGGAPGTGKGLFMTPVVRYVYSLPGARGVIYDAKGDEYICRFYNPEKDIILNFLDVRGEAWLWNFLTEVKTIAELDAIAGALFPTRADEKDPFWTLAARAVFFACLVCCITYDRKTYADLYKYVTLAAADMNDLFLRTRGTEKARIHVATPDSKMTICILAVLVQGCDCFAQMSQAPSKVFNMDEWIERGEGFIYLTNRKAERETLKGFYTVFIETLAQKVLSKPSDLGRRIWCFYDEFATLNKCPAVLEMLNQGRSKGMVTFIGVQAVSQLKQTYGEDDMESLMAGCATKLIFRLNDNQSADYFVKLIGEEERSQTDINISTKVTDDGDGKTLMNRENKSNVLLTSQITSLKKRHAFLNMSGFPITLLQYPIVFIPNKPDVPGIILREDLYLDNRFRPKEVGEGEFVSPATLEIEALKEEARAELKEQLSLAKELNLSEEPNADIPDVFGIIGIK